jgi:hypothetical protein
MCPALNLVKLAFGLQVLIAGQRTGCLLDPAPYLLQSALHMLSTHLLTSKSWDAPFSKQGCLIADAGASCASSCSIATETEGFSSSAQRKVRSERADVLNGDGTCLRVKQHDRNQDKHSQERDHQDEVTQHFFPVLFGSSRLDNYGASYRFDRVGVWRVSCASDDWDLHSATPFTTLT